MYVCECVCVCVRKEKRESPFLTLRDTCKAVSLPVVSKPDDQREGKIPVFPPCIHRASLGVMCRCVDLPTVRLRVCPDAFFRKQSPLCLASPSG